MKIHKIYLLTRCTGSTSRSRLSWPTYFYFFNVFFFYFSTRSYRTAHAALFIKLRTSCCNSEILKKKRNNKEKRVLPVASESNASDIKKKNGVRKSLIYLNFCSEPRTARGPDAFQHKSVTKNALRPRLIFLFTRAYLQHRVILLARYWVVSSLARWMRRTGCFQLVRHRFLPDRNYFARCNPVTANELTDFPELTERARCAPRPHRALRPLGPVIDEKCAHSPFDRLLDISVGGLHPLSGAARGIIARFRPCVCAVCVCVCVTVVHSGNEV